MALILLFWVETVVDMNKGLLIFVWRPTRPRGGRSMMTASTLAAFLALAAIPSGVLCGQDFTASERAAAQTWGMRDIAVIQAERGDFQGAKNTLSQIDENGPKRAARVTAIWFENGRIVDRRERPIDDSYVADAQKSPGWGRRDSHGTLYFLARDRAADSVPQDVPSGLPTDYLDADPEHGALVDFTDEFDSHGTRVTSRRYADGHAVIETPKTSGKS